MAEENTGGASGAGRNARSDLLSSITQLAPLLFGSGKQTTSDTTTSGKSLTPQQLMALTNSLMAGNQGLASVLQPQRQAGLYNSPINTLLAQRLSSEIAAQVAAQGTPTTQSTTRTSQTAAPTIGGVSAPAAGAGLLGLLQAGSMISKAMDTSIGRQVLGQVTGSASAFKDAIAPAAMSVDPSLIAAGNPLLESLGVFGKSTPGAFTGAEGLITKSLDDVAGLGLDQVAALGAVDDVAANIGNSLSDFGMTDWGTDFIGVDLGDSLSGFMDGVPMGSWLSAGMDLAQGDWGGALGTAVGSFFGGPIGGTIGGMLGDPIEDVGKFVFEDIGGGIVDVGEDILGGIGDAVGGIFGGGKVICTELHRQGFMSDKVYAADCAYEKLQKPELIVGYHFWAKPLVKLMRKSSIVTRFVRVLAEPWSREMAHRMGVLEKGDKLGAAVMAVGYPICGALGKLIITVRNVRSAYA